jgi:hypothetical protein
MISFARIMRQVLTERMSFRDLLRGSESGRKDRSKYVNARSLRVASTEDGESWMFTYKSQGAHSTTGNRWHGYIRFFKENVSAEENAEDLDCKVSCDCPDYRFRYAYNNHKAEAGDLGQNNGQPPRPRSQGGVGDYGNGVCKHLIALGAYLKTQISPNAPEPTDPPPLPAKNPVKSPTTSLPPSKAPQTSKAPKPDDTYDDSRSGSETLMEGISPLYARFEEFAKFNPEFEVMYYEDND